MWSVLSLLIALSGIVGATENPPNIIFIIADDLRYDGLACNGNPHVRTPGIDRIAAEGINFHNAFVTTPICSPSRASFLSGLYASTHRIYNIDTNGIGILGDRLVTFPQFLRSSGYRTGLIGKWHMGFDDTRRPGFDEWISFKGQGQYRNPVINDNGRRIQLSGYMTDYLNGRAVDFVDNAVENFPDQPFLLYLSHKAVHVPYLPAPRHEEEYVDFRYVPPVSASDDTSDQPTAHARVTGNPLPFIQPKKARFEVIEDLDRLPEPQEPRWGRGKDPASNIRDQMSALQSVDEGVGQLLGTLEKHGILDETLIVFTSDNGFLQGEHGVFNQKRVAFEESIRIPLLIRYPPLINAASESMRFVLNVDLAPTFLELAGIPVPTVIQGESLLPLFGDPQGNSSEWRSSFVAEYFMEKSSRSFPSWQLFREGDWKYIHYPNLKGADELYHLEDDPHEMSNRINDPDLAPMIKIFKRQVESQVAEFSRARSNDY
ncbi:MAG: sulfatase [Verrucomicrobiales bacterium]|nr:sulfatase [Verrucomicrobiales bacterium]